MGSATRVDGSHLRPAGQLRQTRQPGFHESAPAPTIGSAGTSWPDQVNEGSDPDNQRKIEWWFKFPGNNSDNISNSGNRPEANSNRNNSWKDSQDDNIPCVQPQSDAASNTNNLDYM